MFYPKRSLTTHPSFEMHYVYKQAANFWDDPLLAMFERHSQAWEIEKYKWREGSSNEQESEVAKNWGKTHNISPASTMNMKYVVKWKKK